MLPSLKQGENLQLRLCLRMLGALEADLEVLLAAAGVVAIRSILYPHVLFWSKNQTQKVSMVGVQCKCYR